jgi:hypothetical protein
MDEGAQLHAVNNDDARRRFCAVHRYRRWFGHRAAR